MAIGGVNGIRAKYMATVDVETNRSRGCCIAAKRFPGSLLGRGGGESGEKLVVNAQKLPRGDSFCTFALLIHMLRPGFCLRESPSCVVQGVSMYTGIGKFNVMHLASYPSAPVGALRHRRPGISTELQF